MKYFIFLVLLGFIAVSCKKEKEISSINPENWRARTVETALNDSLYSGKTYLPVYSQIYSNTEHRILDLTATISIRNTNKSDTIFINNADYYDTKGDLIRSYFRKPIFLGPMETVEIVIDEVDREGGTGANFLFEWKADSSSNEPLFESVMISTSGQQGLSFITRGVSLK